MSEPEDNTQESSSSSEDEEPEIDETQDKFFFKTLSCLKNKDPKIYDPAVVFFPKDEETGRSHNKSEDEVKKKDPKPVFLRDYEREQVVKIMKGEKAVDQEDDEDQLPYVEQQKNLKVSFKAALDDSESDSEDSLLKVKTKTKEEKEKEEEDYKAWLKGNKDKLDDEETAKDLKPLHDFWAKPDLESSEQFLRDYILNRRYLEEGEEAEDDGISEDGELLETQEQFETEYNLRFENETNTETKRYPRVIEGSLRKKDESRSQKRKRRLERKKMDKDKKKREISNKQTEKMMEFKEQVEKIKKLTGNDQLGFRDEEIFGDEDFDPDAYDKKMQELYGDAFYSADAGEVEKPDFGGYEDIAGPEDAALAEEEAGPDNMDLEAPGTSGRRSKKETRSKAKRKEKKKKTFADIMAIPKPVFDPEVHQSYQKYIDEYYGMDCEDFIEDIPCRFKYRETVPNDYGLTVEEILAADDKELNQWASVKKITKLRPDHVEKNEVKVYKLKSKDFNLKKKVLRSIYGSPEREDEEEPKNELPTTKISVTKSDTTQPLSNKKKNKRCLEEDQNNPLHGEQFTNPNKKKKHNTATLGPGTSGNVNNTGHKTQHKGVRNKFNRGKGNKNMKGKSNGESVGQLSDVRLKAYDIKPKEFKKKMKFKQ